MMKKFDLNIEQVLENWEVFHALREIIANALDEQVLTRSKDIRIERESEGRWRIRDYGRGLKHTHFTQNENQEKLTHPNLIGRFGVGLKDAMATFDRHDVGVEIRSRHGRFTLGKSTKHAFEDIMTLHAYIEPPVDETFEGTEFILTNISESDIKKAKSLFLLFSEEEILSTVQFGQILQKRDDRANIYINGVKVATEDEFLFSYNITSLTKAMKKELNRERTNVGRTAYSSRVKQILLENKEASTTKLLVESLNRFTEGNLPVELTWKDVAIHSCKLLNTLENVVFLTPSQIMHHGSFVDDIDGYDFKIVTIPENLRDALSEVKDDVGNPIRNLETFAEEVRDSLSYREVPLQSLSRDELERWRRRDEILNMIGPMPDCILEVKLVESIDFAFDQVETLGLWQPDSGTILIARSQLRSMESLAGTLLHERAHASSGRPDVDRGFESALTDYIGRLATDHIERQRMVIVPDEMSATNDVGNVSNAEKTNASGFFKRLFGGR